MLTEIETVTALCDIVGMAYHSIADYTHASDCFCQVRKWPNNDYRNEGKVIDYVRRAVIEKLERDGFTPTIPSTPNPEARA